MLHVVSGDSAASHVSDLDLGGEVLAFREALASGPVSAPLDLAERAAFLGADEAELAAQIERVADALGREPVALWFGRDLFCQVNLAGLIAALGEAAVDASDLSLVTPDGPPRCLDDTDAALRRWFIDRARLAAGDVAGISALWSAYASGDPELIRAAIAVDGSSIVADALARHLHCLPGDDGLGCDERTIVGIARDSGGVGFAELFRRFSAIHPELGWGDLQVSELVKGLTARGILADRGGQLQAL